MEIEVASLEDPDVVELVCFHQAEMQKNSPPGMCYPLGVDGLDDERVTVLSARKEGRLAAIGAIKRLDAERCEIKSMRTHPDFMRQGLAGQVLEEIIGRAKSAGCKILSLETGSGPYFEAALSLYRRRGFENGEAFADYTNTDFNQCLHLPLNAPSK